MSLHVSEIFHSIQGEGSLAGMPSTFIRLAHCNLSCSWCDAAYTWRGDVKFEPQDVLDVVGQVQHEHVVVTGGEPTFADSFDDLVFELSSEGKHVTVETNGTIWRANAVGLVNLWSVSPKLGSSGQDAMLDEDVLREYMAEDPRSVQWKFVIDNGTDFEAAVRLMRKLGMGDGRDHQVFMQPNGLCHIAAVKVDGHLALTDTGQREETVQGSTDWQAGDGDYEVDVELVTPYLDRTRWLYEQVIAADAAGALPCRVRAVVQAHKLAWGNRRGF